jgi:hypothetical protein
VAISRSIAVVLLSLLLRRRAIVRASHDGERARRSQHDRVRSAGAMRASICVARIASAHHDDGHHLSHA